MKDQFEVAEISGNLQKIAPIDFVGSRDTYFPTLEEAKKHIASSKKNCPYIVIDYGNNESGKIVYVEYPDYCLIKTESNKESDSRS